MAPAHLGYQRSSDPWILSSKCCLVRREMKRWYKLSIKVLVTWWTSLHTVAIPTPNKQEIMWYSPGVAHTLLFGVWPYNKMLPVTCKSEPSTDHHQNVKTSHCGGNEGILPLLLTPVTLCPFWHEFHPSLFLQCLSIIRSALSLKVNCSEMYKPMTNVTSSLNSMLPSSCLCVLGIVPCF